MIRLFRPKFCENQLYENKHYAIFLIIACPARVRYYLREIALPELQYYVNSLLEINKSLSKFCTKGLFRSTNFCSCSWQKLKLFAHIARPSDLDKNVRGIVADEDEELLIPVGMETVPLHGGLQQGGGPDAQLHVRVCCVAPGHVEAGVVSVWQILQNLY